ncbi:hypothetical protein A3J90_02420 [candidate division WOR-1 bacterium RIFOXYC2_FULL_37_10]|uniref:Flagellar basal body rod protein FlgB n=1 Tax=candidate division WOR-1 bacterium RIFOXYB2_FULL_37_13 TaxID=1802579 RepID=A0A1F4SL60_UNCSA|nr:MAG: hypothetical protein A2310_03885 [candidate division WOR-1 bacterium RIFOXYB2_FULL_37_13]OGC36248.1 MAG: hypothetical protein A3J90_02420 [candidate division WOR-1 bacterium RIFOXYC2_FULL_37_10]
MFDHTFNVLKESMETTVIQQEIAANNLANINTPGYEPLEFDKELKIAIKRLDKKKVILEDEMNEISQNALKYSSLVKLLSQKINILKTIASQGRR